MNNVQIIGNLGKDPEIRYFSDGSPIVTLTVATNEKWKKDNEWKEKTEWHKVVCFGMLAEQIRDTKPTKGCVVFIIGQIETKKWQDKTSGQERYSTEIRAITAYQLVPFKAAANSGGQNTPPEENYDNGPF